MSRSGYVDDYEYAELYRANVERVLRGARGQALLREMLAALDALPKKELVADDLVRADGGVCALGAVGRARGLDMSSIDPEDEESVAGVFGLPSMLACEVMWINDEAGSKLETDKERYARVRSWVERKILGGVSNGYVPAYHGCPIWSMASATVDGARRKVMEGGEFTVHDAWEKAERKGWSVLRCVVEENTSGRSRRDVAHCYP